MRRITADVHWTAYAVMLCAVVAGGCAGLPRIDPSGERIFLPSETVATPVCPPEFGSPGVSSELLAPVYQDVPGAWFSGDAIDLTLSPQASVAPVGSEVVLLAGVVGPDRYLRTNQRVEWTIAPGGVGQFVEVGGKTWTDWLVGDVNLPRRTNATTAIGSTSRRYLRLTRGTATAEDDVQVLRGQAWISITSAGEGTSRVTAYCPCITSWPNRKRTATIHWVDAAWCFPPPAINPAGTRHVLTTTVTRQTDGAPHANWLVRYEILSGPPAAFAPDGSQAVEVPTDAAGQASVEIFQPQPAQGTNQIAIQVIRPAPLDGTGERLVVGRGTTLKTWSAPELAVRMSGPAVATVGAALVYQAEVSNPGDLPADDVTLSHQIPDGLTYLGSSPEGQLSGRTIGWSLGQLSPGEVRVVQIKFDTGRQGSVTACAEAAGAGGLTARDCATTTLTVSQLDVQISGPERATVGDAATFTVVVTNRGSSTATALMIKDRFDAGLKHEVAESPIERDLGDLAPGQSRTIGVSFRVALAGQWCQTVEILGAGGVLATARACLTAVERAEPQPETRPQPGPAPGIEPTTPEQPPVTAPRVSLKVEGPMTRTVGETAEFKIEVVNLSGEPVGNLNVASNLDASLDPSVATDGYRFEGQAIVWTVDDLPAGGTARFQLHARCVTPSVRACNQVSVTYDQSTLAQERACLEIRSAPTFSQAGLSMTVTDRYDPITAGKELTYEIEVSNNGSRPDSRVTVVVTVPPEMTPVPLQTYGPTGYAIDGQTIRFNPIENVEPGGSIRYRVRVQTRQPGDVRLRAQLTSESLRQPVVVEQRTLILAAQ